MEKNAVLKTLVVYDLNVKNVLFDIYGIVN